MVSLLSRFLRRFHRPAHIGPWGGDYQGDLTFTHCWNPAPGREIR